MKVKKRFHQLVRCIKGPVNTAVIDLLKGHVYQVKNEFVKRFEDEEYREIGSFIEFLEAEELVIEVGETAWIPVLEPEPKDKDELPFIIEMDDGVEPQLISRLFGDFNVVKIHFYGKNKPEEILPGVEIVREEKNFRRCIEMSTIDGELKKITEPFYNLNREFNTCWGRKIAVTSDLKVRPCIHSKIIIGDLTGDDIDDIMESALTYWAITKDRVDKCKNCELRYVCFDCREIALRKGGNLFATNPNCSYNPQAGTWS
jgi:radical SAM protein with 4Fe4S-binding SPASM domain